MKYEEIIRRQIEKIRQVRNDNVYEYPKAIETLWLFLRNPAAIKKLTEHKEEFKIPTSQKINIPDLELWDNVFVYTLELIEQYE